MQGKAVIHERILRPLTRQRIGGCRGGCGIGLRRAARLVDPVGESRIAINCAPGVDFIRLNSGGNMAVATISEQLLTDSAMALSGKSISG